MIGVDVKVGNSYKERDCQTSVKMRTFTEFNCLLSAALIITL